MQCEIFCGRCIARRIRMMQPVGLEKDIPTDIVEVAAAVARETDILGGAPTLWPVSGEIFTEIEAIGLLSAAEAFPISAGGIGGAEGSVRLAVFGTKEQVKKAMAVIESIQGEAGFLG